METTFKTVILASGNNTGIEVPVENLAALGNNKRPPVRVTINGYTYDSTVGVMGGRSLVSLPKVHRDGAGVQADDAVAVTLELVSGQRPVDVPHELQQALDASGLSKAFAQLAYSRRKELARQVSEAKTGATRERRITKVLEALG